MLYVYICGNILLVCIVEKIVQKNTVRKRAKSMIEWSDKKNFGTVPAFNLPTWTEGTIFFSWNFVFIVQEER